MDTNSKITKRDNYKFLRSMVENYLVDDSELQNELFAFIDHEIELLDRRASNSRKWAKKNSAIDDALSHAIIDFLTVQSEPLTIPDIQTSLDPAFEATAGKLTYRLGALVNAGVLGRTTVKIQSAQTGTTRTVNAYALANSTDD